MSSDVSDAGIFFRIPIHLPLIDDIVVSKTVVVSWLVMLIITGLCIFLIRDLRAEHVGRQQILVELIVESVENLMWNNIGGSKFDCLIPFIGALFPTSMISNLISLVELRSPTANLPVEAAWVVTVFIAITLNKTKAGGLLGHLKGLTTPTPVMTPFSVFSEIVTPISMTCRHFGDMLPGAVINGLIHAALGAASAAFFGLIPGVVGDFLSHIPILTVGFPIITSSYFDWFSDTMQTSIFTMLTIMYIANASGG